MKKEQELKAIVGVVKGIQGKHLEKKKGHCL